MVFRNDILKIYYRRGIAIGAPLILTFLLKLGKSKERIILAFQNIEKAVQIFHKPPMIGDTDLFFWTLLSTLAPLSSFINSFETVKEYLSQNLALDD